MSETIYAYDAVDIGDTKRLTRREGVTAGKRVTFGEVSETPILSEFHTF